MTVPHAANDAVRLDRRWPGLIATALLAIACGFAWAADGPAWLAPVLGVATLAGLGRALRPRDGWRLIGPHFYFDLIRMARKGRTTVLRVLFLLALLGGIGYIYREYGLMQQTAPGGESPGPSRLEVLSHFNAACVYTWFLVQNLAILVLAPAYVGGAIAEERESHALELLFTTALYDREIVLGKFAARVLHLGGFLLAGLPIFSMMQVWGGVDLAMLLGNWINSVLLLLTVSSICMAQSTMPTSATSAVIASYCVVVPVGFCCMAATYPLHVYDSGLRPGYYLLMASLYAGTIAGCLILSVRSIRRADPFPAVAFDAVRREMIAGTVFAPLPAVPPLAPPPPSASDPVAAVLGDNVTIPTWTLPPVQDDALLWKERYTGGRTLYEIPELLLVGAGLLICGALELLLVAAIHVQEAQPTSLSHSVRIVALMCRPILTVSYASLLFAFTVGVAFRAAASVVRERQQHTLDMLLTLPVMRGEILRAKFLGAICKGCSWAVLIACVVFLGAIVGAFHPITVAYLLLCPIPLIVVVCSVALLVSVIARTVLQANLAVAGMLLGATVLALQTQAGAVLGAGALNLSMWDDVLVTRESLVEAALYLGTCFAAAVAAWSLANRLFERADRR